MKQAIFSLNFALALCLFTTSVQGDTITWASGTSGNWSNPNNWNPSEVPGPSDTAIINATGVYTVTLDTNTSVSGLVVGADIVNGEQTLLLYGKTLSITGPATVKTNGVINLESDALIFDNNGDATIYGALNSFGGTLSGALNVASNGIVNLAGILPGTQTIEFSSFTLTNYGTVTWSNIDVQCQTYLEIDNYGLWDAQTNNVFYGDPSGISTVFNNYGTFQKDGGAFSNAGSSDDYTEMDSNTAFNNFGTVNNQAGLLSFYEGTSYGGSVFNTASNLYTGFGNDYMMAGDVTFTGPGYISGALNGNNAVLHGTILTSFMTFYGSLTLASDGVLSVSPIQTPQPITFAGTTFTNYGTVIWTNTDLYGQSSPQIYNYGLWDATMDNTFHGAGSYFGYSETGTTTFNNYGTVRKDGGTSGGANKLLGPQTIFDTNTVVNNSGLMDIQTGLVKLEGNCSLSGGMLNFGISGPTNYGSIYFDDTTVQFTGQLSANFRNNYSPETGDGYVLAICNSESGKFTSLRLPSLPAGLSWQTNYNGSAFTLAIVGEPLPQLSAELNASGKLISLSWYGLSGQTYQVQCATNLAPPVWVNLGDPIAGTNGPITVLDSLLASPQKYYRIESQ